MTPTLHKPDPETFRLSQINPLRGLSMKRVVDYLEAGERGEYPDLQWLYRMVEKRDATLRACKRHLLSSVMRLDWEIKIVDNVPKADMRFAEIQQAYLRKVYDGVGDLRKAIQHLTLAEFRGFAHLEKIYHQRTLVDLVPVPQWHFVRDGLYGAWEYVEDARSARGGVALKRGKWIVREVDDPVDEIALIAFVYKSMAKKDWGAFVENYGIPWFFLEWPSGLRPGTPEYSEFLGLLQDATSNCRGGIPHGTTPHVIDAGARAHPFNEYIQAQDKEIILSATSSLLTMLAESGSGTLAGNAHQDTFDTVAQAIAMLISEELQKQIDVPELTWQWPGSPVYAYFELAPVDDEDASAVLDNAVKARSAGMDVDAAQLSEKTGLKLTPSATPPPAQQGYWHNRQHYLLMNRDSADHRPALDTAEIDEALRKDLAAIYEALSEIESLPEAEQTARLIALRDELPDLFKRILESGETPAAWERLLGTAVAGGMLAEAKTTNLPEK